MGLAPWERSWRLRKKVALVMKKSKNIKYLNLSFQFFIVIIFFSSVGYFMDQYFFDKVSLLTLLFPIIGFVFSLYRIYRSEL